MVALEHAAKSTQPAPPAVGNSTDVDHYGGRRIATELGPLFFDTFVHEHDVALVNFHAPWWCVGWAQARSADAAADATSLTP